MTILRIWLLGSVYNSHMIRCKKNKDFLPGLSVLLKYLYKEILNYNLQSYIFVRCMQNQKKYSMVCVYVGCFVLALVFEEKGKMHLFAVSDRKIWYFCVTGRPVLLTQQSCQSEIVHYWRETWLCHYHFL